jgi:hypothetical protein
MYRSGSHLSHFGRFRNLELGFGGFTRFGEVGMAFESFAIGSMEEMTFKLCTSSTDNISKRFFDDNGGIPLTRCPRQNPLCSPPFLPLFQQLVPLLPSHLRQRIRPVRNFVTLRNP